ncbi:MAG: FtsX-like permease family protein [Candidatus Glassbacteria bacterium]
MKSFVAIAWRNLWRNLSRSLIMIAGIAVGLFGLLIYYGISNGFIDEMVKVAIQNELAHIQINRLGYLKNPVQSNSFAAGRAFVDSVAGTERVLAAAGRFRAPVLINSAEKSSRVELIGINPEAESRVTILASLVTEGEYLSAGDTRKILLGGELARQLGVGIGDKLVVMAQDRDNELQSQLLRVVGIFRSNAPSWDKVTAFVVLGSLQELLNRPGELTSVLVRVHRQEEAEPVRSRIRETLTVSRPELEVRTWLEVMPMLAESINMFNSFVWIFYLIIYLAMAFGVINIMLMAVIDRTREIGVMRAVGTTPGQVLAMVLLEATFLGLVGIAVGGSLAWIVNGWLETRGLDLSNWSGAMGFMGISSVVHSNIESGEWIASFVSAELAVVAASVWPAWRSSRLRPVEAIQFQ